MQVIEVARFGGPEVLTVVEAPDPVPGPGEAVVEVAAAEVLWVETMIRSGHGGDHFPVRPPYRPGPGVAGTVTEVGEGVDPSWLGRRVVTPTGPNGGYVQRALEPAAGLIPVPDAVPFTEAAALLHDGVTALGVLEVVALKPGNRVLITAAAGGMGALLVQLAHTAGAHVTAAARGTRKLAHLSRLGADEVVDYSEPDWTDRVGKVDVVLDGAGGAYGRAALRLVVPGGRFSGHGTPAGSFAGPGDPAAAGVSVTGIEAVQFNPEQFRRYATGILAEAAAGRVRPLIGQTFPLANAADAHTALENRTAVGKTVLICG